ncbi:MAG TPA: RimK/LysX family protein [Polyangia bacterium]|nr:RimK/LysX family protein [Polyangia bacterium]
MLVEPPARGIRVGGITIAPGESRAVRIALGSGVAKAAAGDGAGTADAGAAARAEAKARARGERRDVPAWGAVGQKAGPRVSVVAATRGFEATAALAASALVDEIDPAVIAGSVVVVPVLRAGGQFAPGGRPRAGWEFPGDAGGKRAARDAFTLYSELVVGASVVVMLGSPAPGRRGALTVRADLTDLRTRRIALQSGAVAAVAAPPRPPSLLAAAAAAGAIALELRAAGAPGAESGEAEDLVAAVRAVLMAAGVFQASAEDDTKARAVPRVVAPAPAMIDTALVVRAAQGGLVQSSAAAGQYVHKGAVLARVIPPVGGRTVEITAPRDGLILESTIRTAERAGARLFLLGPLSRAAARRRALASAAVEAGAGARGRAASATSKLHVGWVENVMLPNLGIVRLKAKIDTGARSSALHVSRMRTVDTSGGPGRRPILEIVVPSGVRGAKSLKVRAAVREYVVVRDTSGRMERRPVIETALQLGPLKKRIAVTLTNRGEMLFPMLIGRTALGPEVTVDPSRRYLISG